MTAATAEAVSAQRKKLSAIKDKQRAHCHTGSIESDVISFLQPLPSVLAEVACEPDIYQQDTSALEEVGAVQTEAVCKP